jgi:hypothetical protein
MKMPWGLEKKNSYQKTNSWTILILVQWKIPIAVQNLVKPRIDLFKRGMKKLLNRSKTMQIRQIQIVTTIKNPHKGYEWQIT